MRYEKEIKIVSKVRDKIIRKWEKENKKSLGSLNESEYLDFIEKYSFKNIVFKV